MSAKFEGILSPGEAVVVQCSGVWLQGVALETFTAAPGAPAVFSLKPSKLLAGAFPPVNSFEKLAVNSNNWDIYRASDFSYGRVL